MPELKKLFWNTEPTYVQLLRDKSTQIVISPFIQQAALEQIIVEHQHPNLKIITRWNPQDICSGVSDLEIYPYLRDLRIPLYIHSRIHLKLIITDHDAFHMSSNITGRGLGLSETNNVEVGCFVPLGHHDWIKIYELLNDSIRVSDAIYETAKQYKADHKLPRPALPELKIETQNSGFSILDLPATPSPQVLANYYFAKDKEALEYRNACIHDLLRYKIRPDLTEEEFYTSLKPAFCTHPFIEAFVAHLREVQSASFGRVKEWLQRTCSDQPTPYRWELTANTQHLYAWTAYFFDEISWDRPNHSMILRWTAV